MRRHERALYGRPFAPVAMLAVLAACASGPPPDQEIAAADLAVQAAHASTAGSLAPDELLFLGDDRRAGTERDVPVQVLWMSR